MGRTDGAGPHWGRGVHEALRCPGRPSTPYLYWDTGIYPGPLPSSREASGPKGPSVPPAIPSPCFLDGRPTEAMI